MLISEINVKKKKPKKISAFFTNILFGVFFCT